MRLGRFASYFVTPKDIESSEDTEDDDVIRISKGTKNDEFVEIEDIEIESEEYESHESNGSISDESGEDIESDTESDSSENLEIEGNGSEKDGQGDVEDGYGIDVESDFESDEIDTETDAKDPIMAGEYKNEIFDYLRKLEAQMLPTLHYMSCQPEIKWSMRSHLIGWLVEVHQNCHLMSEVLFLCINYIDRFLSSVNVAMEKLQLVGLVAFYIAAKYECREFHISVRRLLNYAEDAYTVEEALKTELFILTTLEFKLGWPGPMSFLRRISKADNYHTLTRTLAKYFLEVAIMDEQLFSRPPSLTAASAYCLAFIMTKEGDWGKSHIYYSGYKFEELLPVVNIIMDGCRHPESHHVAVYKKYSEKSYKRASILVKERLRMVSDRLSSAGHMTIFTMRTCRVT